MRIDAHQHLSTEPLVAALARRSAAPRLRRRDGAWRLEVAGEGPSTLPAAPEPLDRREAELAEQRVDLALVALSPALGAEGLPGEEASELLDAFAAGVREAPVRFRAWAAVPLAEAIDPTAVDHALATCAVGLCLPSGALADPEGVARCEPLLARLARRDAPLFVHPGPSPWSPAAAPAARAPAWWPALTGYVASMNAAWHAWAAVGRAAHPSCACSSRCSRAARRCASSAWPPAGRPQRP